MSTFNPAASNDDSCRAPSTLDLTGTSFSFGYYGATGAYHSYVRFPNVTVPKGATITSAKLTFVSYNDRSTANTNVKISANDVDDSVAPTTTTAFDGLVLTTAEVEWNNIEAWTAGNSYDSPDIKTVIQEIVDRAGWASGQAIGMVIKNNGSSESLRQARSYDYGSSYPVLTIEYSVAGSTTSTGDSSLPVQNIVAGCDGVNSSLPLLSAVNCYVDVPHCELDESLPVLTISATGITGVTNTADNELPLLTVSAAAGFETDGTVDEGFPALFCEGTEITGEVYTGDVDIPDLLIGAAHKTGRISNASIALPPLTIDAADSNFSSLDSDILLVEISAYAYGPIEYEADNVLPLFEIAAYLERAQDAYRIYVLNTRNNVLTEYEHFDFNSFCTFQGKNLGAHSSGIMSLEGDDDNGTGIDASFGTGVTDFRLPNKKKITDAYLNAKGDGGMVLTVITDDGLESGYPVTISGVRMKPCKVPVGKGKKGRSWEFILENVGGGDFELNGIDLNVELLSRKI